MPYYSVHRQGYLLSGVSANRTGSALDLRAAPHVGYLYYANDGGQSAIFGLQASHDLTAWMTINSLTALNSAAGTGQFSAGYYPYLRAVCTAYSGGGHTGVLSVYYAAGIVG